MATMDIYGVKFHPPVRLDALEPIKLNITVVDYGPYSTFTSKSLIRFIEDDGTIFSELTIDHLTSYLITNDNWADFLKYVVDTIEIGREEVYKRMVDTADDIKALGVENLIVAEIYDATCFEFHGEHQSGVILVKPSEPTQNFLYAPLNNGLGVFEHPYGDNIEWRTLIGPTEIHLVAYQENYPAPDIPHYFIPMTDSNTADHYFRSLFSKAITVNLTSINDRPVDPSPHFLRVKSIGDLNYLQSNDGFIKAVPSFTPRIILDAQTSVMEEIYKQQKDPTLILEEVQKFTKALINIRLDGTPFLNLIKICVDTYEIIEYNKIAGETLTTIEKDLIQDLASKFAKKPTPLDNKLSTDKP